MAHGFLTPTPVTGDNFLKNSKEVKEKLDDIKGYLKDIRDRFKKDRDTTYRSGRGGVEVAGRGNIGENTAVGGGMLPGRKAPKMLRGATGEIEKNPINVDLQTGAKVATPGGPKRLPGTAGKGGTYTNIPGVASAPPGGIKDSSFFSKTENLIEKLRASGKSPEEQKLL